MGERDADAIPRPGYKAALAAMNQRGREWVARSGNGVLFVHPVTVV